MPETTEFGRMAMNCLRITRHLPPHLTDAFAEVQYAALRFAQASDNNSKPDPRWEPDGYTPRETWDANVVELHGHSRRVVDDALALVEDMR